MQPGDTAQVQFLLIHSSIFDPDLTYDVLDDTDGVTKVKLKSVQSFTDAGMLGLLRDDPKKFKFKNETDTAADIRILVGRKAESSSVDGGGP